MRESQNTRLLPLARRAELLTKFHAWTSSCRRCSCTDTCAFTHKHIQIHLSLPRLVISPFLSPSFFLSFSNFLRGLSCNPSAISRTYLVKVSEDELRRDEKEGKRETSCSTNSDSLQSLIRHFRVLIPRAPSRRRTAG